MKILIIGANGFLGSALFRHYQNKKANILSFSYRPETHELSIANIEALIKQHQFDLIINAGGSQNGQDDLSALKELIYSNILFPSSLASIIKFNSPTTCLISFGTSWQIGETGNSEPFNAYASSKSGVEPFFDHFALDGVKIATLRLYDTYGPNDKRKKIINLIADALISKSVLEMTGGNQAINFVHIEDVIAAVEISYQELKNLIESRHLIYSIKSKDTITVLQLLDLMKNILKLNDISFIKPGVLKYRKRERFNLIDNLPTPTKWVCKIGLMQGLNALISSRKK
jgi:CDP-3, 6-dideoxy-D-glycero-L-glycero-4-hexulose-4-reductase